MIAEADTLTPANPFDVHTLNTSHLAPITRAGDIAGILAGLTTPSPAGTGSRGTAPSTLERSRR